MNPLFKLHSALAARDMSTAHEELDRLHCRLSTLESLFDVQVPVVTRKSLGSRTQTCVLEFADKSYRDNMHLTFNKITDNCKIWHNTLQSDFKSEIVTVKSLIMTSDVSNGWDQPLVVAHAEYVFYFNLNTRYPQKRTVDVVLKMRKTQKETDFITQTEAQNMVDLSLDKHVCDLFPDLIFAMTVKDLRGVTWECVANEPLERPDMDWQIFYTNAYHLLCKLHTANYVHGDCHHGNFMVLPKHSSKKRVNNEGLIFIDQDCIQRFPITVDLQAVTNLMIIRDMNILLFSHNPYIPFIKEAGNDMEMWQHFASTLYRHKKEHSLLRMPWFVGSIRDLSPAVLATYLRSYPDYKKFLEQYDMPLIHELYKPIFMNVENMQRINDDFGKIVREGGKQNNNKNYRALIDFPMTPPEPKIYDV